MELKPKPTKEQSELIHEMYEYIMELMQTDLKVFITLEITNLLPNIKCYSNNTGEMESIFSVYFFYHDKIEVWKNKFQSVKDQILAIINEVDIQEITDKNQNIGC